MKKLILALGFLAIGLVVFNCFYVDFSAPMQGDSIVALVGIVAIPFRVYIDNKHDLSPSRLHQGYRGPALSPAPLTLLLLHY